MSLGANRLASSSTWVDSALFGSQAELSFCWALFSLPASGPAAANTPIQNARTTHLLQRPLGRLTIRRTPLMTPPAVTAHTIDHGLSWPEQVNRHPHRSYSDPPTAAALARPWFIVGGPPPAVSTAAGSTPSPVRRSPVRNWTPSAAWRPCRVSTRIPQPAATSPRTTRRPRRPVPPVTRMGTSWLLLPSRTLLTTWQGCCGPSAGLVRHRYDST